MTDPGDELAQRAWWEADRRRALLEQQCARADAEAEAADRERAAEAADAADTAAFTSFRRQLSGEPLVSVAGILERSRLAEDGPVRDPSAPWGSAENPALVLDGIVIEPGPPRAQRSQVDKDLDRAHQLASDLTRYRRQRSNSRREVIRSLGPADEITCLDCIEHGATAEESFLLHAEPDAPRPRLVPDEPPREHSTRAAGTSWPSQVPMIYR